MNEIRDAILADDLDAVAGLKVPESYRAVLVRKDEQDMFEGVATKEKDPRKALHVEEVPTPELGPGEAIVAVMASAVNYNTVWTSIFEPVSTFGFLERYGRVSELTKRHDLPYHVVGSDLAGVVLAVGPGVGKWKAGDEVVAHCLSVELEDHMGHDDTMLDPQQRIWGFETNFGGLAELALVKSNQLMPKPAHLTWEEAAAPGPGELDGLPAAGQPQRRADEAGRRRPDLGCVGWPGLLRHPDGPQRRRDPRLRGLQRGEGRHLPGHGRRADHRPHRGGLPVLEGRGHPGPQGVEPVRQADPRADRRRRRRHRLRAPRPGDLRRVGLRRRKGGIIVTCASTSGYMHQYDNRYLWMNLKRIIGSHFANYREAWEANRLIDRGLIHPTLSKVYAMEDVGQAAYDVHNNPHQGKVGVLCPRPRGGPRRPRPGEARRSSGSTASAGV